MRNGESLLKVWDGFGGRLVVVVKVFLFLEEFRVIGYLNLLFKIWR